MCRLDRRDLEVELGADLDSTWHVTAGDLAESRIRQVGVHAFQVGVIEGVEELAAQLELVPLGEADVLDGGEIPAL